MSHNPSDPIPIPENAGFAALLEWLGDQAGAGAVITLGDALDHAGSRMHGAAILLLAIPDSIPLPIPSVGAILGGPLIIISAHLALFGEHGNLPQRARRVRLPNRVLVAVAKGLVGLLKKAEHLSHERLPILARRERLVGVICMFMALLLLLPIPLMNAPPALAMVFMSWGLLQRDGLFVAIGMSIAAGFGVAIVMFTEMILTALSG